jgi:hypothetical protein
MAKEEIIRKATGKKSDAIPIRPRHSLPLEVGVREQGGEIHTISTLLRGVRVL